VAYLGGDRPRPRGLGRATATTSATFLPHCEQRIRVASVASATFLPTSRASASGSMCLDAPHGAGDPHDEVTKGIVEFLDVRQHAHGRMVRSRAGRVYSVGGTVPRCMRINSRACASRPGCCRTLSWYQYS
jgi:hypothetical protein